jgi:hypothetical protein
VVTDVVIAVSATPYPSRQVVPAVDAVLKSSRPDPAGADGGAEAPAHGDDEVRGDSAP